MFETYLYYAVVLAGSVSISREIMKFIEWLDTPDKKA